MRLFLIIVSNILIISTTASGVDNLCLKNVVRSFESRGPTRINPEELLDNKAGEKVLIGVIVRGEGNKSYMMVGSQIGNSHASLAGEVRIIKRFALSQTGKLKVMWAGEIKLNIAGKIEVANDVAGVLKKRPTDFDYANPNIYKFHMILNQYSPDLLADGFRRVKFDINNVQHLDEKAAHFSKVRHGDNPTTKIGVYFGRLFRASSTEKTKQIALDEIQSLMKSYFDHIANVEMYTGVKVKFSSGMSKDLSDMHQGVPLKTKEQYQRIVVFLEKLVVSNTRTKLIELN